MSQCHCKKSPHLRVVQDRNSPKYRERYYVCADRTCKYFRWYKDTEEGNHYQDEGDDFLEKDTDSDSEESWREE